MAPCKNILWHLAFPMLFGPIDRSKRKNKIGSSVAYRTIAKLLHCVRTACVPRTQRPGYSPKNTCHLSGSTAKQQRPHENNEMAFDLVLHCPHEQPTQTCKVQLSRGMQDAHMFKWQDTLGYITRTVATQLATNTIIIFLLLNGCLLLCPHRLRHMRPRSIGWIPSLPADTKLSNSAAHTLKLYHHIRGSGCPFDVWQQTWERHKRREGAELQP